MTELTAPDQTRIEKIQKLLAKAERASTQAEADAFYEKAQDLMSKWAIDEAALQAEGKSTDELVTERVVIKRSSFFKAYQRLAIVVAQANKVKVLMIPASWGKMAGVELIGWRSDIERTKMMYTSLMIQASKERNRQLPAEVKEMGDKFVARWRNSFSMGYAVNIGFRLAAQARETEKQAVAGDYKGTLLPAVVSREKKVQDFYDAIPKGKPQALKMSISDASGYRSGAEAANRADLGKRPQSTKRLG